VPLEGASASAALLIRLLTFQPGAPGEVIDQYLRQGMLQGLANERALRYVFAGRTDAQAGARAVLSIWGDGTSAERLAAVLPFERNESVAQPVVEIATAAVALTFDAAEEPVILRIFRGRAKAADSALYLEAVRDGTLADVAAGQGPLALFLGMLDTEHFITASAWSDWRRIEAATGGNIRQPIATRHSDLLIEGTAEHFEIVPNSRLAAADVAPLRLSTDAVPPA
jgi:hypothetical protein